VTNENHFHFVESRTTFEKEGGVFVVVVVVVVLLLLFLLIILANSTQCNRCNNDRCCDVFSS